MKRWIPLLFALLFTLLAGCRPAGEGKTRVRVIFWGAPEEVEIITNVIRTWEKDHPDIQVDLEHAAYPSYVEKILTQVAGNSGPDVIFTDVTYFSSFYAHDMFLDLTPYVNESTPPLTSRFFPEIIDRFTRDGKIYCIPRDIAPITCVYYNKKALDEAGLPYPKDDWDQKTFLDYCRRLTKREGDHITQYGIWAFEWANFVFSNGGAIVDNVENPTRCMLDTPEARAGLQFYHDLIHKEKVMPSPQQLASSGMSTAQYFANEKAAMYLTGIWETPQLLTLKAKFDWDIARFPSGPNGIRGTRTGGSGYCILKTSKHPDIAWEVVKALAGAEGQKALALTGLAQPADAQIAAGPAWALNPNPPANRGMLNEAVKTIVFDPFHPKWIYMQRSIVDREIELYLLNRQSLDDTVGAITTKLNTELRKK